MTFIKELKRRNVFKVGVAYLVGAWLIIQVVETVFPLFGFGNEPARIAVIILAAGFIFTLVISWVYELTPDGLKKEKDIRGKQRITRDNGNRFNVVIIGLLVMAVGFFAYDKFVLGPGRDAAATLIAVAHLAVVRETKQLSGNERVIAVEACALPEGFGGLDGSCHRSSSTD